MTELSVKGIVFDMYGTLVDVGAVAEACKEVAPDPIAFNNQWRAKQLEYALLRSLSEDYRDFWKVTEEALEFSLQRFGIQVSAEQRKQLMNAWLHPSTYPEVAALLPRLKLSYMLSVLSNGTPQMLRCGLDQVGLQSYFHCVLSADAVKRFKPSPQVYQLAVQHLQLPKEEILFVSSNSWDAAGAKRFGFKVCWINRSGVPFDTLGHDPDLLVNNFDELANQLLAGN